MIDLPSIADTMMMREEGGWLFFVWSPSTFPPDLDVWSVFGMIYFAFPVCRSIDDAN